MLPPPPPPPPPPPELLSVTVTAALVTVGCVPSLAVNVHVPEAGVPDTALIVTCDPAKLQTIWPGLELITPQTGPVVLPA